LTSNSERREHTLDTTGLSCPEPVMLLHGAIRDANSGDMVVVTATDPSTLKDIPKFCRFLGHDLFESGEQDGVYTFKIVKG